MDNEIFIGIIGLLIAVIGYFIKSKYKTIEDKDSNLEKLLKDVTGNIKVIADELVTFRILHAKESEGLTKDVQNIEKRVIVLEKLARA